MRIFLWKGVMEAKKEYLVKWEVLAQAKGKGGWEPGEVARKREKAFGLLSLGASTACMRLDGILTLWQKVEAAALRKLFLKAFPISLLSVGLGWELVKG